MKHLLTLLMLLGMGGVIHAQNGCNPPSFFFNNLISTTGSGGVGSTYTFSNVTNGVNAIITITKAQNATTSNSFIDVPGVYPNAWQPYITFPASRNNGFDSSYLEFKIEFRASQDPYNLINENCFAMTIIDCDGANSASSYREMVKVSLPGTPRGVANSTISVHQDAKWILYKSGTAVFNDIDTNNAPAMGQTDFPTTVNTFYMRVGVVGPVNANQQRQFSFYFKSFPSMVAPLPVDINGFRAVLHNGNGLISWAASGESNLDRYEVYRSFDGRNFTPIGSVKALNWQQFNEYLYQDNNVQSFGEDMAYYRLKVIETDGQTIWSSIAMLDCRNKSSVALPLKLYPNPANSILNVNLGYVPEGDYAIQVLDIYGKSVIDSYTPALKGSIYSLDISSLDKGMYLVNIMHADGSASSGKFIKY
jgi:hypothetical protein